MISGIPDRSAFVRLRNQGIEVRSTNLRLRHLPAPDDGPTRVAYMITRRVGSAVTRNRLRRRIVGAMQHLGAQDLTLPAGDSLFVVEPASAELGYGELQEQVAELLNKLQHTRAEAA